jgi:hypothetical protein
MARSDLLFRQDTAESLRSAIRLEPDAWDYYMRLAQLDEYHAQELLIAALRLNAFNSQADIELGLRAEAAGDTNAAETYLLKASAVDNTYVPRWSLANFYLRRGNTDAFWAWSRRAVAMPAEDIGALFDLCWHVTNNPEELASRLLNNNPDVIRQYLRFILRKNQAAATEPVAERLIPTGEPSRDRTVLFEVVNQMLTAGDGVAATSLWRNLIQHRWVEGDDTSPYNPGFTQDPLPVAFDWALMSYPGIHSWPGPSGLETEFSGNEPEDSPIAEQIVVLTPGTYAMEYTYSTSGIAPGTGVQWQIVNRASGRVLGESPYLSSETLRRDLLTFSVDKADAILRLRLVYERVQGTPRIEGRLTVASTEIHRVR